MSQLVSVGSPTTGREVRERYSRIRSALFPPPPPQPKATAPKPMARAVYNNPVVIRGPSKLWLARGVATARRAANEERRVRAIEAALRIEVPANERAANIGVVIDATARHYGIPRESILAIDRGPDIVRARHVAMYLAAERKDMSFTQMGRVFDRDHSSVFHAMSKVKALVEQGGDIAADVRAIREMLA